MADEVKPRAVSGEFMTDPAETAVRRDMPAGDIIDADYISIPAGPAHTPRTSVRSESLKSFTEIGSSTAPNGGMDMLRRQLPTESARGSRRAGPLFWAFGVVAALVAFWIAGGHELVRGISGVGMSGARSALRISGVTSRVEGAATRPILFVDGETVNDGKAVEHLPALEIAVTDNDGLITRYRLGTSGRPLDPGETFAFSSRLDAPKNGVKIVTVTFAE